MAFILICVDSGPYKNTSSKEYIYWGWGWVGGWVGVGGGFTGWVGGGGVGVGGWMCGWVGGWVCVCVCVCVWGGGGGGGGQRSDTEWKVTNQRGAECIIKKYNKKMGELIKICKYCNTSANISERGPLINRNTFPCSMLYSILYSMSNSRKWLNWF